MRNGLPMKGSVSAALVLSWTLYGCSYATVTTVFEDHDQCTAHYIAPVVDTAMTGAFAPGVLFFGEEIIIRGTYALLATSGGGPVIILGYLLGYLGLVTGTVGLGISAYHGYTEVSLCRDYGQQVRQPRPPSPYEEAPAASVDSQFPL